MRQGDTIIIWKLDRLARSTRDLLELAEKNKKAGASFKSISEPWADTTSPARKMILTVFSGIAEFERDLIRESKSRFRSCIKKRKKRGRPHVISPEKIEAIKEALEQGASKAAICRMFEVKCQLFMIT